MFAEPAGKILFGKRASGNRFHGPNRVVFVEAEPIAVVGQEKPGRHPRGSLVAIDKAVIAGQPLTISRSERRRVGECIGGKVSWAGQSRFNGPLVADAVQPAMLG